MARRARPLICLGAAATLLLALGFVAFAAVATRSPAGSPSWADGVVVLTGGNEHRIEAGLRLLRSGIGHRLLISGVNRRNRPEDLPALAGAGLGRCCIDLGYEALDTIGNALEARDWAVQHGFARLVVVTSSYHMPRSLAELGVAMPGIELVAYPVQSRLLNEGAWWLRPAAAKLLLAEYAKLLPAYVRYGVHRATRAIAPPAQHPIDAAGAPAAPVVGGTFAR